MGFYEVTLCPKDEFILLACDGLFDVMDNQTAVDFVLRSLHRNGGNARVAVKELVCHAVHDLNSNDNVTACILMISGSRSKSTKSTPPVSTLFNHIADAFERGKTEKSDYGATGSAAIPAAAAA